MSMRQIRAWPETAGVKRPQNLTGEAALQTPIKDHGEVAHNKPDPQWDMAE